MKKHLFLSAYLRTNPGDDMMVLTLLRRYPNTRFFLYCHPHHRTCFQNEKNVRFISPLLYYADRLLLRIIGKEPFRLKCRNAESVIQIGGSMYIEPVNFNPDSAAFQLKPQFIIGANFGPYKTTAYVDHIRKLLCQTKDVCFRDQYSASFFADLPQVRQAPDVLFGYKDFPTPQAGKGVGISIIDPSTRPELQENAEAYFETVSKLVGLCCERDIPVTLLSFCTEEGDGNAVHQIRQRTKSQAWNIFTYTGDPDALLNVMNGCECIFATRFHAMIIGWMLKKKVMPIIYSNKQKNVLGDLGCANKLWNLLEGQTCTAEELLEACMSMPTLENTDHLAQQAAQQFFGLDRFIEAR